jgi:hypothetical protein
MLNRKGAKGAKAFVLFLFARSGTDPANPASLRRWV